MVIPVEPEVMVGGKLEKCLCEERTLLGIDGVAHIRPHPLFSYYMRVLFAAEIEDMRLPITWSLDILSHSFAVDG